MTSNNNNGNSKGNNSNSINSKNDNQANSNSNNANNANSNRRRKRSYIEFDKDLDSARRILGVKEQEIKDRKVYPAEAPEHPQQYIDVVDDFDMRFERQSAKRRILSFATRCQIIELRFGSYGQQYSIPIRSIMEVAKMIGLKHEMVSYTVRRYVKNKGFLMVHPMKMPRRRNRTKMTREIIDHITDRAVLRAWAHLSLAERVLKVEEIFHVKLTEQCLGQWYRKNSISYRRPSYKMLNALKKANLLVEQAEWCWQLTGYMQRGFTILWIDETTTHLWDQRGRVWQPKDEAIHVYRPADRGHSVTIMAALASDSGYLYWSLTKSTNQVDFLDFLKNKIHPFVKYPRSTVLVMDNHRAHHSNIVTAWLEEKSYVVHFLPTYSSELNPVETVWALLKTKWGKTLHSKDFETKMLKIATAPRAKKNEFDIDSDGEIVQTTKQKLSQRELNKGLQTILIDYLTPERLKKIAKGCTREMIKVMMLAKEAEVAPHV